MKSRSLPGSAHFLLPRIGLNRVGQALVRCGLPKPPPRADGSYDEGICPMAIAFAVAFGGSLGALSRYGIDTWIEQRSESLFPWATFVINMTGCFAVGFLIAAIVDRHNAPQWLRTGLV